MADELIQKVFDESAVQKNIDAVIASLDKVQKQIEAISKSSVDIFKGAGGKSTIGGSADDMQKAVALNEKLTKAVSEQEKQVVALTQALNEKNKATKLEVAAENEMLSAYERLKAETQIALNKYRELVVTKGKDADETKKAAEESRKYNEKLKEIDATVSLHQKNVGNYGNATESLRTRIRSLTQATAEMELQGNTNNETYRNNIKELGRLKDAMGDVQARSKFFADDARWINASTQAVQGLVGAYSVYQGLISLVGKDNKDLQETMKKMQSLMTVMMGLQQISNVLNKDSMVMTAGSVLLEKARAIQIAVTTNALRAQTVAATTGGAAAKVAAIGWKALQVAMSSNVFGMALIAISAIAIALYDYSQKSRDAAKSAKEMAEFHDSMGRAQKKAAENYGVEIGLLEQYKVRLQLARGDKEKFSKIVDDYNNNIGKKYNATLTTQKNTLLEIEAATKKAADAIIGLAMVQAAQEELTKLGTQLFQTKQLNDQFREANRLKMEQLKIANYPEAAKQMQQLTDQNKAMEDQELILRNGIMKLADYVEQNKALFTATTKTTASVKEMDEMIKVVAGDMKSISVGELTNFYEDLKGVELQSGNTAEQIDEVAVSISYVDKALAAVQKGGNFKQWMQDNEKSITRFASVFDSATNKAFSTIEAYLQRGNERVMNGIQEQFDISQSGIQRLLDEGIISQEEYEARSAQLAREREAREREERRKFAKRQRDLQAFQAIINTAAAVTVQLATGVGPEAIAMAVTAGLMGALEIAAIYAQPLPEFAKGRDGGDATWAKVGERGFEYIQTKTGELYKTPNVETITYLPKDSKVYTHGESLELEKMINLQRISAFNYSSTTSQAGVIKKLDDMEQAILNKPTAIFNIDSDGVSTRMSNGTRYQRILNNHYSFKN